MSKHTPGPWEIHRTHQSPCGIKAKSEESDIAKVYLTDEVTHKRDERHMANARLIAAAPDLLAALIKTTKQLDLVTGGSGQVHDERMALIDAKAAIAKATGEGS